MTEQENIEVLYKALEIAAQYAMDNPPQESSKGKNYL